MAMLDDVKTALQLTTTTYNAELTNNINECMADIAMAGITNTDQTDPAIHQIVILFCKFRFELMHGNPELALAIKGIYDEQKRQLGMATGYTDFEEEEDS